MPTNKLWIEHTERAAWESVKALRERLEHAESRLQTVAPLLERLQPLLDALSEAKLKYAPDARAHDEVVARLLTRVDLLQHELDAARSSHRAVTPAPVAPARPRLDSEDLEPAPRDGRTGDFDVARFALAMQRHHEQQRRGAPPRDLNRLLSQAEDKLDEMSELDGRELREAALELAILAGKIHAASRGV